MSVSVQVVVWKQISHVFSLCTCDKS